MFRIAILSAAIFLLFQTALQAQSKDELAIRRILAAQTEQWNNGDLEKFMEGY